jgi:hypothetical protein
MELIARYRIQHLRTCAALIGKEIASALWNHLRLVMHVLPASRYKYQRRKSGNCSKATHLIPFP